MNTKSEHAFRLPADMLTYLHQRTSVPTFLLWGSVS